MIPPKDLIITQKNLNVSHCMPKKKHTINKYIILPRITLLYVSTNLPFTAKSGHGALTKHGECLNE